ncbi:alpha/beta hydrolase fold domain-containing protein [Paracoccus sp. S-4012]|uniref:alpha/beta hydrolase n=1 Tax=Paracoccus sp. S-4012 TaxID=2665648 RepID=UPI0012AF8C37|nr:alpha/beta hydrolase [Paracoccus sp. S-4012]MRX51627.1 alpha/beta hydrolase fold domain-containing protein [Paracoccus sp. S-4012]
MIFHKVDDFTDAYANAPHIAGGDRWPDEWVKPAADYRAAMTAAGRFRGGISYGPHERHALDLFLPDGAPRGLVVFIHGGYWKSLDRSYWSHFAYGAVQRGFAVAMPSYQLCPEVRITDIGRQIAAAIACAAGEVPGQIAVTGHSAGGHLTARMVSSGTPLPAAVLDRIRVAVPISGLHDLRPLMRSELNADLRVDEAEALAESPALLRPVGHARICAWVGGAERSEFLRQNELLANVWTGLGAATCAYAEPDRHHFDVLDGLTDPNHALTRIVTDV